MKTTNAYIPYPSDADLLSRGLPLIQEPTLLVIHAIGERIKVREPAVSAIPFLNEQELSCHLYIDPEGNKFQCRPFNKIAWHAKGFNTDSIGIEVGVEGDHGYSSFKKRIKENWVTDRQYNTLVESVIEILREYPIATVVRHSDIDPNRKVDPGDGFPWQRFLHDIGIG